MSIQILRRKSEVQKSFRNLKNIVTGPLGITWKGDDVGDGRIRHCLEVFCGTGIIEQEYEMMFNMNAVTF